MTFNPGEAFQHRVVLEKTWSLFCLTHTYTGFPAVKEDSKQVT